MSFDQLISTWSGRLCDVDGFFGGQCMDLAHRYAIDCVGKDLPAKPAAKDLWNVTIDGYDKVKNTPEAVPQKGDIIIWGTEVGAYGHIAIFVEGDAMSFRSFDQNWPVGTVCHIQNHNYTGVLGWFHPKELVADTIQVLKSDFERLVSNSTKYDAMVQAGYTAPDQIKALLDTLEASKKGLETQIATLENALKGANNEIGILQEKLGSIPTPENPIPKHTELSILGLKLWILNE